MSRCGLFAHAGWGDRVMRVRFRDEITREALAANESCHRAFRPEARSHCPITPTKST